MIKLIQIDIGKELRGEIADGNTWKVTCNFDYFLSRPSVPKSTAKASLLQQTSQSTQTSHSPTGW
ncbi:MAG: hypothetical protein AAB612_02250 [Patescibacteria group bacterium]